MSLRGFRSCPCWKQQNLESFILPKVAESRSSGTSTHLCAPVPDRKQKKNKTQQITLSSDPKITAKKLNISPGTTALEGRQAISFWDHLNCIQMF